MLRDIPIPAFTVSFDPDEKKCELLTTKLPCGEGDTNIELIPSSAEVLLKLIALHTPMSTIKASEHLMELPCIVNDELTTVEKFINHIADIHTWPPIPKLAVALLELKVMGDLITDTSRWCSSAGWINDERTERSN